MNTFTELTFTKCLMSKLRGFEDDEVITVIHGSLLRALSELKALSVMSNSFTYSILLNLTTTLQSMCFNYPFFFSSIYIKT